MKKTIRSPILPLALCACALAAILIFTMPALQITQAAVPVVAAQPAQAGSGGVVAGRFVKLSAAGIIATATACTDSIVGVCEATASQYAATRYAPPGTFTNVDANGNTVAVGDLLTASAAGVATAVDASSTSAQRIGAIALTAGDANTTTVKALVVSGYVIPHLTLTADSLVTSNHKLEFRYAGAYIYSDANNSLSLVSDGRIKSALPIVGSNETLTAVTGNVSVNANDSGKVFNVTATAVISLPASAAILAGVTYTFICDAADGAAQISLSPDANDCISGVGTTGTDNKDYINTLSTAKRGDWVTITCNGAVAATATGGWAIVRRVGTWAWEQ